MIGQQTVRVEGRIGDRGETVTGWCLVEDWSRNRGKKTWGKVTRNVPLQPTLSLQVKRLQKALEETGHQALADGLVSMIERFRGGGSDWSPRAHVWRDVDGERSKGERRTVYVWIDISPHVALALITGCFYICTLGTELCITINHCLYAILKRHLKQSVIF